MLNVIFYRTETGGEPVREWIKALSSSDKKTIGDDIKTVQFGWPIGMPLVRHLDEGIWEIRIKLLSNRIARILFFMDRHAMILVVAFIKKTENTPISELELAKKRKRNYQKYVR